MRALALIFVVGLQLAYLAPANAEKQWIEGTLTPFVYNFSNWNTPESGFTSEGAAKARMIARSDRGCGAGFDSMRSWPTFESPYYRTATDCIAYRANGDWWPEALVPGVEKHNNSCVSIWYYGKNTDGSCRSEKSIETFNFFRERGVTCPIGWRGCDGSSCSPSGLKCFCEGANCTQENADYDLGGICNDLDEVRDETNPVNVATDSKYYVEADYIGMGKFPLKVLRFYDSRLAIKIQQKMSFVTGAGGSTNGMGGFSVGFSEKPYPLGTSWRSNLALRRRPIEPTAIGINYFPRPSGRVARTSLGSAGHKISYPDDLVENDLLTEIKDAQGKNIGFAYYDGGLRQQEVYDKEGKLVSVENRNGELHRYNYEASTGLLQSVVDSSNRKVEFKYDGSGRIREVYTPRSYLDTATNTMLRTIKYDYDIFGNLSKVTDAWGKTRTYLYENSTFPTALTGVLDELGRRIRSWNYDNLGYVNLAFWGLTTSPKNRTRVSRSVLGQVKVENLAADGSVLRATDYQSSRSGSQVKFGAASGDKCASCSVKAGSANSYDTSNRLKTVRSSRGRTDTLTYGLSSSPKLPTKYVKASGTPQVQTVDATWDEQKKLPRTRETQFLKTTYDYDNDGSVLHKTEYDKVTGRTRVTKYEYIETAFGKKLKSVTSPRGYEAAPQYATVYEYKPTNGDLYRITNSLGQVTTVEMSPTTGEMLWVQGPNGVRTNFAYHPNGKISTVTTSTGGVTRQTRVDYHPTSKVYKVIMPDKSFMQFEYSVEGRVSKIINEAGDYAMFEYDENGNNKKTNVYNSTGTLFNTASKIFNRFGDIEKTIGAVADRTVGITSDLENNITEIKDAFGNRSTLDYDSLNRVTSTMLPNGGRLTFEYDSQNRILRISDPNYLSTSFEYDGFGNVTRVTSPDAGVREMNYDSHGNMISFKDGRSRVTNYVYDRLDRLTSIIPQDPKLAVTFIYDEGVLGRGKLTTVRDNNGYKALFYNGFGDVTHLAQTVAGVETRLIYTYDVLGRLTSVQYPSSRIVSYSYGAVGSRITGVSTSYNGVTSAIVSNTTYLPFGGLSGWTFGNGKVFIRAFDLDYNVKGQSTTGVDNVTYSYDSNSLLRQISDTVDTAYSQNFSYSNVGELTSATGSYGSKNYNFDLNGNRLATSTALPAGAAVFESASRTYDTWSTYVPTYYFNFSGSMVTRNINVNNWSSLRTHKLVTSGKWYWEIEVGNLPTVPVPGAGVMVVGIGAGNATMNAQFAGFSNGWGLTGYGSKVNNDVIVTFGQKTWVKGDTIGVALDVDTKVLRFFVNGLPANGTDGIAYSGFASTTGFTPMISMKGSGASAIANFGNRAFKYSAPSGFAPYDPGATNFLNESFKTGTYTYNPSVNYTINGATATKKVTQTTSSSVRIEKPITSGKWYWEAEYIKAAATTELNRVVVGVAEAKANLSTSFFQTMWGYGYHYTGLLYNGSSTVSGWPVASAAGGDVISVLFDADIGALYFYKNGIPMKNPTGLAYSNIPKGTYYPAAVMKHVGDTIKLNLGRYPFRYGPIDSRFKPLDPGGDGVRPLTNQLMAAQYDLNGNPTLYSGKTLTYNDLSRLTTVSVGATLAARYWYNADGLRTTKRVGNTVTGYVYDLSGNMMAEIDGVGRVLKEYVYLGGERVAMVVPATDNLITNSIMPLPDATRAATLSNYITSAAFFEAIAGFVSATPQSVETPGVYFYHNDYLGAPKSMTNMTGVEVWKGRRDPYGLTTIVTQTIKNNHRLPGQYFDAETGWHQNWMRDYDPIAGRYLQIDPAGLEGGHHFYKYALNDPVNLTDRKGTSADDFIGYEWIGGCDNCVPRAFRKLGFDQMALELNQIRVNNATGLLKIKGVMWGQVERVVQSYGYELVGRGIAKTPAELASVLSDLRAKGINTMAISINHAEGVVRGSGMLLDDFLASAGNDGLKFYEIVHRSKLGPVGRYLDVMRGEYKVSSLRVLAADKALSLIYPIRLSAIAKFTAVNMLETVAFEIGWAAGTQIYASCASDILDALQWMMNGGEPVVE